MRLITYRDRDGYRAGVLGDSGVVDAAAALGQSRPLGLRDLLVPGRFDELSGAIARGGQEPLVVQLEAPVPDPEKIICIGLNYRSHAEEAGIDPPSSPTFFGKYRNALAAPGATVTLPEASDKVDYEAEVAVIVGRRCSSVSEAEALDAVAGYTLLNDLSARDLQFATPQWMPGKVFDGSAPCGPALVTPDEAAASGAIEIALELNGETMQSASTSDLVFSVAQLTSHLSRLMTLEPGDIVSTGTPSGVGSVRQPRVWLEDGDRISVRSPTLGELRTTIRRQSAGT
jgi:2-keto-4-pentenoate hydratase/2-oxohepta-3-ene-1,7-dioic acid hydratase in catechol pathway